ncbi:MAG: HD domain-containing protein [Candidatus Adiutrix sp.]|jgi:HD-GYP domain-containing protein (c-di-GMP phosphodiesterase class II)|nr:HD domain-containing protein [Candidatus Adiutrix sp.]
MNMFDLVKGFAGVVDMVNATLAGHHLRVAGLVDRLGERLGLDGESRNLATTAAMLHDIGVITLRSRTDDLVFEADMSRHSRAGWMLLRTCRFLAREAEIVLRHHDDWSEALKLPEEERRSGRLGNLVHLADVVDVHSRTLRDPARLALSLRRGAGGAFEPESVQAMLSLLEDKDFFDGLGEQAPLVELPSAAGDRTLFEDQVVIFSKLFSHVIDARSPFTASHSSGVALVARLLHEMMELPAEDRSSIFVAGLLHDIGKMGVPRELIEKAGALDELEFAAVKQHARISLEALTAIPGFERLGFWGGLHHERLSGQGYCRGFKGEAIPMEARVIAVADVLTALTEDRPYRAGLNDGQALKILDEMAAENSLDADVVGVVHRHIGDISPMRAVAQKRAVSFLRGLTSDIQGAVGPEKLTPKLLRQSASSFQKPVRA